MMPFIPNDKFDISSLEKCWNYLKENISNVEIGYSCELAAKTYELFSNYNKEENVPKNLIVLISSIAQFTSVGKYEKYSIPDVMKEIAGALLYGLSTGFCLTVNNGKINFNSSIFGMTYNGEWYQLEASTFDISPILNKQRIKI